MIVHLRYVIIVCAGLAAQTALAGDERDVQAQSHEAGVGRPPDTQRKPDGDLDPRSLVFDDTELFTVHGAGRQYDFYAARPDSAACGREIQTPTAPGDAGPQRGPRC